MRLTHLAHQTREVHVEADDARDSTKRCISDGHDARPWRSESGLRTWRGMRLVVGPDDLSSRIDQHGAVLLERVTVARQDDQHAHLQVDTLASRELLTALDRRGLVLLEDDRGVLEPGDHLRASACLLLRAYEQLLQ